MTVRDDLKVWIEILYWFFFGVEACQRISRPLLLNIKDVSTGYFEIWGTN